MHVIAWPLTTAPVLPLLSEAVNSKQLLYSALAVPSAAPWPT